MKKITKKQKQRDIRNGIALRNNGRINAVLNKLSADEKYKRIRRRKRRRYRKTRSGSTRWELANKWFDSLGEEIKIEKVKGNQIILHLPEKMNFYEDYEATVLNLTVIRKLAKTKFAPRRAYKLLRVNFERLKKISTPAALVLTAELSKWDDAVRSRLRPVLDNWDPDLVNQFKELGFFELFNNHQISTEPSERTISSDVNLVKYIKGKCGDGDKARTLKYGIREIVGDDVTKWTFLHSGLTEAITNVSHHAYPDDSGFLEIDKYWYMTGSYSEKSKQLKIVFYDQGIGIPKSLPASEVWERVLTMLSVIPKADQKKDEVLLKAAVELDRTSTTESDRGKGLQDLLEFIRQRQEGYLSIISLKGLFKFSLSAGIEKVKTEHFKHPLSGTLIIWNVTLG